MPKLSEIGGGGKLKLSQVTAQPQVGMSGVTREQRQADIARMDAERAQRDAAINAQTGRGRAANITGRSLVEGLVALPDMFFDPLVQGFNKLTEKPADLNSLITGERGRYVPKQMNLTQGVNYLADLIGGEQVRPETGGERVLADTVRGTSSAVLPVGVGRQMAQSGNQAINRIGQMLSAQPAAQIAGGGLSGAAAGTTREAGGGEGAQLAAGLAGAMLPTGLPYAGEAVLQRLAAGRNPEKVQQTISDFAQLGTTPSLGQATGNRAVQGIESLLAGGPTSAGVVNRFAENQASQIGEGLKRTADNLSRNASGERAGRAIERGINGPDGFTEGFKKTQDELFSRVDSLIPADSRIDVSQTMDTLGGLNAPIPGAPNVSKLFQNQRVAGIGNALEQDIAVPTPQQGALDEALGKLDTLYNSRNAAVQDMGRFRSFANDQANRTDNWYPVEGLPRIAGRYSPFPGRAAEGMEAAGEAGQAAMSSVSKAKAIEDTLGELQAAAAATEGKLPYEAIKKLRTLVGQELQDAGLMSDFPRSKFKALYASLSGDMESAARAAGPEAHQAFQRANNYTRAGMARVEAIERVIDKSGGPEKVFEAAMSGTKDGGTTLRSVMQSLPPEGQRAVTAAVIKRMGLATPGAQDAAGDVFSAQTFLTNWNRVSPEAKRALFDRHGPQFSQDMDRISRVAENIRDGSKVYANPAGTANRAAAMTYGASLVGSLFTGGTTPLVAGGVGANIMARVMTNPNAMKRLAAMTTLPRGSIPAAISSMATAAQQDNDPDMAELAQALQSAAAQEQQ